MSDKVNLTVVILTLNEEVHISNSINNVVNWAKDVFILDSFSTDRTCEIAKELGATIFTRKFDTYANQRNYAIKELPILTEWMLFLDADEYLEEELKREISTVIPSTDNDGFLIAYKFFFNGKWIKYGGYYPTIILRLFKVSNAQCSRDMNEHIDVKGKVGVLNNNFVHSDQKGITEWIHKHNKYATYEARELIKFDKSKEEDKFANLFGTQPQRKRWIREKIWNKLLPPLIRPFIYYFYRYVLRLGFLDGKQGFIFHFLHGFWFPFLIDVKYLEMKKRKCVE